jgi:DNA-binding beta-propeller fold protein YncE
MKLILVACICGLAVGLAAESLKLQASIPLPGVKGRIDHLAVDVKGHRLFVAALGNNTLEVVDLATGKVLKRLSDLHRPTDVLYLPEQNRIAVADSDEGTLRLYNGSSYELEARVGSLPDADNLRLTPDSKWIYVGYGEGALGVIDTATSRQTASIKVAAHPEAFQAEQTGKRIFVNVPEAKHIAVIDRDEQKVIAKWPMEKFQGNYPMALDESSHRLFVACRDPARLVVLDTRTGKIVADVACVHDADDLFYDAARKRLYLSCGEGSIDVFDQRSPDTYVFRDRIQTRFGARTSLFSPELKQFFVAVPKLGKSDAEIRVYQVAD